MFYVFDDMRVIYKSDLLTPEDEGHYIAVDELPPSEFPDKQAVYYADTSAGMVLIEYRDMPKPDEEDLLQQPEVYYPENAIDQI